MQITNLVLITYYLLSLLSVCVCFWYDSLICVAEIGLLKYIERKGYGATLDTCTLPEKEPNILDRVQGIRYEGD